MEHEFEEVTELVEFRPHNPFHSASKRPPARKGNMRSGIWGRRTNVTGTIPKLPPIRMNSTNSSIDGGRSGGIADIRPHRRRSSLGIGSQSSYTSELESPSTDKLVGSAPVFPAPQCHPKPLPIQNYHAFDEVFETINACNAENAADANDEHVAACEEHSQGSERRPINTLHHQASSVDDSAYGSSETDECQAPVNTFLTFDVSEELAETPDTLTENNANNNISGSAIHQSSGENEHRTSADTPASMQQSNTTESELFVCAVLSIVWFVTLHFGF